MAALLAFGAWFLQIAAGRWVAARLLGLQAAAVVVVPVTWLTFAVPLVVGRDASRRGQRRPRTADRANVSAARAVAGWR